jgi:hypothetical protein
MALQGTTFPDLIKWLVEQYGPGALVGVVVAATILGVTWLLSQRRHGAQASVGPTTATGGSVGDVSATTGPFSVHQHQHQHETFHRPSPAQMAKIAAIAKMAEKGQSIVSHIQSVGADATQVAACRQLVFQWAKETDEALREYSLQASQRFFLAQGPSYDYPGLTPGLHGVLSTLNIRIGNLLAIIQEPNIYLPDPPDSTGSARAG